MKFVAFSRGWADEFTAYGFAIMEDKQWDEYKAELEGRDSLSYYFGTNEGWDDEPGTDYLSSMEVTDITSDQAAFLADTFKLKMYTWDRFLSWGQFPDFDFKEIDMDQDEW